MRIYNLPFVCNEGGVFPRLQRGGGALKSFAVFKETPACNVSTLAGVQ